MAVPAEIPEGGIPPLNPNIPLECQPRLESDDSTFDIEQIAIMALTHSADLICIENAADIARRVLMRPGVLEMILTHIASTASPEMKCVVARSETFPHFVRDKISLILAGGVETSDDAEQDNYNRLVKKYRTDILKLIRKHPTHILAINAVYLSDDYSGHYASYLYELATKKVHLFDSMQYDVGGSVYTPFFIQLANDVFKPAVVDLPETLTIHTSPQLTGGFSEGIPYSVHMDPEKWDDIPAVVRWFVKITCTESQNHFCYMWAIWSLHMRLKCTASIEEAFRILFVVNSINPLLVIKKYIWALMSCPSIGLLDEIPEHQRLFFQTNWGKYWGSTKIRDEIVINDLQCIFTLKSASTAIEALAISYEKPDVTYEVPGEIPETCLGGNTAREIDEVARAFDESIVEDDSDTKVADRFKIFLRRIRKGEYGP